MMGVGKTVKATPLLFTPLARTTTVPVVAPVGTGATMVVVLQLVTVAGVPLKVSVLAPCAVPKLLPVTVIDVPTAPEAGEIPVIVGAGTTAKETPAPETLFTVTTTLPLVAPFGTVTTIELTLQLNTVAVVPLNLTVLVPRVAPKPVPVKVTDAPTAPEFGERLLMTGVTVNLTPLLPEVPTVTTTLPVVAAEGTGATILLALHEVGVAVTPLNVTLLVPCVEPKLVPDIVTELLTAPDVGDKLVIFGAACATVGRRVKIRRDGMSRSQALRTLFCLCKAMAPRETDGCGADVNSKVMS